MAVSSGWRYPIRRAGQAPPWLVNCPPRNSGSVYFTISQRFIDIRRRRRRSVTFYIIFSVYFRGIVFDRFLCLLGGPYGVTGGLIKCSWCFLFRPPVYGSNGRSYKMLVMFFSLFFATRSRSSLDRSPWNFATWSESDLILWCKSKN